MKPWQRGLKNLEDRYKSSNESWDRVYKKSIEGDYSKEEISLAMQGCNISTKALLDFRWAHQKEIQQRDKNL